MPLHGLKIPTKRRQVLARVARDGLDDRPRRDLPRVCVAVEDEELRQVRHPPREDSQLVVEEAEVSQAVQLGEGVRQACEPVVAELKLAQPAQPP